MHQQQGDLLIKPVKSLPDKCRMERRADRGWVLAEGEATGHAHVIEAEEGVTVHDHLGTRYIVAETPVTLRHEEHGAQTIPPGTYRVDHVQEFDYERLERRRVRDSSWSISQMTS